MEHNFDFVDISKNYSKETITLDKYGRLRIGSKTRKLLNIDWALSPWITLAYDSGAQAFAIQKTSIMKHAPEKATGKMDQRGYVSVRKVINDFGLRFEDGKPIVYQYNGEVSVNGEVMLSFRAVR